MNNAIIRKEGKNSWTLFRPGLSGPMVVGRYRTLRGARRSAERLGLQVKVEQRWQPTGVGKATEQEMMLNLMMMFCLSCLGQG